jgi:hypothetical protein
MEKSITDPYEAAYAEAVDIMKREWLDAGMTEEEWQRGQEEAERTDRQAGERWEREQRVAKKRSRTTEAAIQTVQADQQIVSAKRPTYARARKPQLRATKE